MVEALPESSGARLGGVWRMSAADGADGVEDEWKASGSGLHVWYLQVAWGAVLVGGL